MDKNPAHPKENKLIAFGVIFTDDELARMKFIIKRSAKFMESFGRGYRQHSHRSWKAKYL